tara:strand:- start:1206 stop:1538 length:333 start_codon:yes stop_codon:yes gene_type:complete
MIAWTIQWIIISLILILLIHNIFLFLKDTLTVEKSRNIVSTNDFRYKELASKIQFDTNKNTINDNDNMELELKNYINNGNKNDIEQVTEINNIVNLNEVNINEVNMNEVD